MDERPPNGGVRRGPARPLARVRRSCAAVGASATRAEVGHVRLMSGRMDALFEDVFTAREAAWVYEEAYHYVPRDLRAPEAEARLMAYLLTLAALNYGSGYAPYLRRDPPDSTYYTISSRLAAAFEPRSLYRSESLLSLGVEDLAEIFAQDLGSPPVRELMERFTRSLRQLGAFLLEGYDGSALAFLESTGFDSEVLVDRLVGLPTFDDRATYDGFPVFFYKKAQLFVADLARVRRQYGWGEVRGLDQLTMFADNAVAQVLRVLGVLRFDAELDARIQRGELLPSGSRDEVEIRASSINAGQMLVDKMRARNDDETLGLIELDYYLWKISHAPPYYDNARTKRHLTPGEFY